MILAIDPGAKPGFCLYGGGVLYASHTPPPAPAVADLVIEDQHAATHIYRGGKKVAVSRKSQQGLSFTAGRLFERYAPLATSGAYRIPVADWRRALWKTATRLTKPVVLARLHKDFGQHVEGIPAKHQGDVLEAIGIAVAWSTLTAKQKAKYECR